MIDPNVYALSISLALDTTAAFESLDSFGDKVTDIESQVAAAGKKAIGGIDDTIQSIVKSLDQITESAKKTGKSHNKELEFWQDIYDHSNDKAEFAEDELKKCDDMLAWFDKIIKVFTKKNKKHDEELDSVMSEVPMIQSMWDKWKGINGEVDKAATNHMKLSDVLRQMLSIITEIDQETENFVTTNYRAYGSQQELVQQTRELSMEFGILRTQALEAYKILGDLKMPRHELDRYAKAVAMANRFTGVGIQQLSEYSFRMRQVGWDAQTTERQLVFVSEMMRKFGLSTNDVNRILGRTKLSAAELELIFKGEDQAGKYDRLRLAIAGLAKQVGFTSEVTEQFFQNLEDPIKRAQFSQYAGQSIESMEDFQKAIAKASKRAKAELDDIQKAVDAGSMSTAEAAIKTQALADAYGFGSAEAMIMAARLEEVAAQMGFNLENAEDLQKAFEKLKADAMDPFNEANNTLTAQLRILRDRVVALIGYALQPLADVLRDVLKWVNWVIDGMMWLGQQIYAVYQVVKIYVPWLDKLVYWLKLGAVAVLALGAALIFLGIVFGLIPGVMSLVTGGITGIFRAIGEGLRALGESVQSVMLPLLALGAAFLMVGVGAYFFALSVKTIAELGWVAIPALLGMIAVIGILGLVLVGLATLIQGPIAIGMVILAATFLALGLAAMMAGYGFYLVAQGLAVIAKEAPEVIKNLPLVAAGIFLTGLAVLLAANMFMMAGIILLPAATLLLAGSVVLAAASLVMMAAAPVILLASLALAVGSAIMFVAAGAMLISGIMLLGASAAIIASGLMLTIGGGFLLAGAIILGVAMAATLLSSAGIAVAAFALGAAAWLLLPATARINKAGDQLAVGGAGLHKGAIHIQMAVAIINQSTDAVRTAGTRLNSVGTLMVDGAVNLFRSGQILSAAAMSLASGAVVLVPAAIALYVGIGWVESAVFRLTRISPQIVTLATSMHQLAWAFQVIHNIPSGEIGKLATDALSAMPAMDRLASGFEVVADRLSLAATQIESATERIQTAINTKAVPAMMQADKIGMADAVRSEAITTVQVMDHREGNDATRTEEYAFMTLDVLKQILSVIQPIMKDNKGPLASIQETLERYLATANTSNDSPLGSEMNQWMS